MTDLVFRNATSNDIATILELCRNGAAVPDRYPPLDLSDPAYLSTFELIDADPNHRLIVAENNGETVGTLQISFIPGLPDQGRSRGMLENIHVRADQRGQGIGGRMVEWAVEQCRQNNCWLVQLSSNKLRANAHRFYAAIGFKATHEGFKLVF